MRIDSTNNTNITKENIETESLVNLTIENIDISNIFSNSNTAESAREFFLSTSIHEKVTEIITKLKNLTREYSDEAISDVFKQIVDTDHQLFADIMTAAYFIAIKYDDKKYAQCMYNLRDFIDSDIVITDATDENPEKEISEEVVIDVDEDEDIK